MFIYAVFVLKPLLPRTQSRIRMNRCANLSFMAAGALAPWIVSGLTLAWFMWSQARELAESMNAENATETFVLAGFG